MTKKKTAKKTAKKTQKIETYKREGYVMKGRRVQQPDGTFTLERDDPKGKT